MRESNTIPECARISIVDDDESMREAISTLIGSIGLIAEEYSSAEDFLDSGRSKVFDCLILDVRMPGVGGLELQHRLAADHCPVPIVFITGQYSEEERKRAMEAGAIAFLSKPFTEQELLNAIGGSLANHKKIPDGSNKYSNLESV
ncbi:MAG: response regulator [Pyrinomonadaceae bacterium]|nr:response regulator [Pyrinomonadaceae bacterium]